MMAICSFATSTSLFMLQMFWIVLHSLFLLFFFANCFSTVLRKLPALSAGINSFWRNRSLRAQVMSSTERSVLSPSWLLDMEDKPEHLLVLVHGILAR